MKTDLKIADAEKLEHIRHSLAHLLAAAVLKKFPDAKLGIGPTIENGFYYDFLLPQAITPDDLKEFEKTMRHLIGQNLVFEGKIIKGTEAKKIFKDQPFKLELIKELEEKGEDISIYETGTVFTDLCRGGHVVNTKEIPADGFMLDKIAGAYWHGDEKNPMLQRIYGLAFASKKELEEHLKLLEEAKKRDHKILGPALDLFTFSDLVGAGLPLWTPKGTIVRNLLDTFVWELRKARGYVRVEIPHITKKDLYQKSGHWDKFKDELFRITTREGHEFAMKPMNCPHHTQIYARKKWSYRELPQRYENTTMCYRDEQSGELSGLSRVRSFTQDDAHVFCRMIQIKEEFLKIWDIVHEFYTTFGLKLRVRLSLHDPARMEKYIGDIKKWEAAENILREIVTGKETDWFEGLGEAAFYGPKLDFMAKDSLGREWQVATIQIDMNMPERFNLFCIDEKSEQERIVMIHAAIMGSTERFLSVIIEHFAGAFPVWLAPVQVAVVPVSEKTLKYGKEIYETLCTKNIRTEFYEPNESLGKRIRAAEMMKVPYILVVGEKEEREGMVNIRNRKNEKSSDENASTEETEMKMERFAEKIEREMRERTR